MTKKKFLFLVLVMVIAGGAFAQSNWVSGEVSLIGAGATYERMLTSNFSVGANAYWTSFFIVFNDVGAKVIGRWYPWGTMFYAELGVGLGIHTGTVRATDPQGASWSTLGTTVGLDLVPGVGWKIDVGEKGGFFVEPMIQLPITIGVQQSAWAWTEDEFGFGIGFRAACGFGYAF
jgi:hypothetical protein